MKLLLVFAAVFLTTNASSDEELWTKFKQNHGKTYKSLRDEKLRFNIFKNTLKTINEHNAKFENGEETWFMGINQFSDLTDEEFKAQYLSYKPIEFESLAVANFNLSVPNSIDWRLKGAVLSVKNQGQCGSCWAFSAVGAIEGQNAIKHGIKTDLSEQELLDCSHENPNRGCHGGNPSVALLYVEHKGIAKFKDYPYRGSQGSCHGGKNSAKVKVSGVRAVARNENSLKQAVASVGPISVGIASEKIRHYSGGIFNNPSCGSTIDHAVLVVGYGSAHNQDFWIVKNSWSASWGEKGFIKMARNKSNQCGIASMATFPVLR